MQKLSIKKLSVLGLVLIAASAVAAAFTPSTKDNSSVRISGTLVDSGGPGDTQTCKLNELAEECGYTATAVSGTTGGAVDTDDYTFGAGANNTQ